ncbi:hypothetical protein [Actinoplanes derwentensis]|uniref:Uncharacterized protein n=1 Tax=Actinoplanes derwentensis TaxID=113562 RepID=A0A1H2DE98_9ACTN|nr:hypothetical protein [Actinoplanes derwentensis]SDT80909.1 hypothetical protein SAMN04489716_9415 [Actinoplanes derwentensis]
MGLYEDFDHKGVSVTLDPGEQMNFKAKIFPNREIGNDTLSYVEVRKF